MSQEYNSKLISELYHAEDISEILDDILDVVDPVFAEPLIDAYIRTKDDLCLYALSLLKTNELGEILQRKLGNIRQYKGDVPEIIGLFGASKTYPADISKVADELLLDFRDLEKKDFNQKWGFFGAYGLERILDYLKNAGKLDAHKDLLDDLFFGKNLTKDFNKAVIEHLIRIKPSERIAEFIDRYEEYKKTNKELVLSEELLSWQNGRVPELKALIVAHGSSRAAEILKQKEEQDNKKIKESKRQASENLQNIFENNSIIQEILDVRRTINLKSLAREDFKFEVFIDTEIIGRQAKIAVSEAELKASCIDLRDVLKNLSEKFAGHGYSLEKSLELIPGAAEATINGSVNQLALFLLSRGFTLDQDLWGLRSLLRIVNLLAAHPNETGDLVNVLKAEGLFLDYQNKQWSVLHRKILGKYLSFLQKIKNII